MITAIAYLVMRSQLSYYILSIEVREDKGGARVWLETYFDVDVFIDEDWQPPVEQEESVSQVRALNSSKTL